MATPTIACVKPSVTPASSLVTTRAAVFRLAAIASVLVGCSVSGQQSQVPGQQPDSTNEPATEVAKPTTIDVAVAGPDKGSGRSIETEPARVIVATASSPGEIVAYSNPTTQSEPVAALQNPTPIGAPLVFQVVGINWSPESEWIEVHLPIRPNGSTGWVRISEVELRSNPYRIEVHPDSYELLVYRNNELVLTTAVGIGTGETPTPIGRFYIIELLETPDPNGAYGPYAFGLSGFSETLSSFAGGDGVIGIHGTNDDATLGTDVSHGCIRVSNDVITEISTFLPLGTPVIIQ